MIAGVPDANANDTARVGTLIDGRYRILEFVGSGGMGAVYRAEHTKIRRTVALKILHRELVPSSGFTQRFEREAFLAGRTAHPNCVGVSDFGRLEDGTMFLVMEYVKGRSLADILDEHGRIEWQRAFRIARHVLRGLAHAHAASVVHRDVKPENVILVDDHDDPDFAKVVDFGIAKAVDSDGAEPKDNSITSAGTALGTPSYISPEQALGRVVDARTDLYSLSVLIYAMVCGDVPFSADDTLRVLSMHMAADVPTLASKAPDLVVPAHAERVIFKGLEKKPEHRYADADDYIAAIDEALASAAPQPQVTAVTTPPAPMRRVAAWSRRRLIAGGLMTLVVILVLALTTVRSPPRRAAPHRATAAQVMIAPPGPSDVSVRAAAEIERGKPLAAIDLLAAADISRDPHALMQKGHAYSAVGRTREAKHSYDAALSADRSLADDAKLVANVRVAQSSRDPETLLAGLELGATYLSDDDARRRLVELAVDKRSELRGPARDVCERVGCGDDIDRFTSFSLDLRYDKSCDARKQALSNLAELNDKRAIKPIRQAKRRTAGGFLGIGAKRVNKCLEAEADAAIARLEGLE
jgi:eukaryotic-like serine/threonine-protein kinase